MRRVCLLLALVLFSHIARAQDSPTPAPSPSPSAGPSVLTIDLTDGSRLLGTPGIVSFKVTTGYATFDLSLAQVRGVEFDGTDDQAHFTLINNDLVTGKIAARDLPITTIFGAVRLPIGDIRQIRVASGRSSAALPDGLILRYTFDKDDQDKVVDSSSHNHDGKVVGATFTDDGKNGGGMHFAGNGQGIIIGNLDELQGKDFTVSLWIRRDNNGKVTADGNNAAGLVGFGHNGWLLGIFDEGRLFLTKVDVNDVDSQFAIDDTSFHHVAITKRGGIVTFYLDGGAKTSTASYDPGFNFDTDAAVGCRSDGMGNSFIGTVDNVEIYNRALSADEIQNIYNLEH